MHYRIVFLIPYFGKIPEYIKEWSASASYLGKQGVDFYIISDDSSVNHDVDNITYIYMTFEDFRSKIQSLFIKIWTK